MSLVSVDEQLLRVALEGALEERLCPPGWLLFSKEASTQLEAHSRSCERCQARRRESLAGPTTGVLGKLAELVPEPRRPLPAPGQVWSMRPDLGGWDSGGRFLSPPWVLILRISAHLPEAVRVAQLYSDQMLMGAEDLALPDSLGGFAEPWNVYTGRRQLPLCGASTR